MLINFNEITEMTVPGMNGGTGEMSARMYMSDAGKIIPCRIHAYGVGHSLFPSAGMRDHQRSSGNMLPVSGTPGYDGCCPQKKR